MAFRQVRGNRGSRANDLISNRLERGRHSHDKRDGDAGRFDGLFVGNELGFWDGSGHGHPRFVHALFQAAEEFDVILPRTLLALDIEFLGGYRPT